MITIIGGLGFRARRLAHWRERLPGVEIHDLPGFGSFAPNDLSLEGFIEHFAARLPPEKPVVGESLGGLIALGLARRGYRVMVVDPPLTTAKQWALHNAITLVAEGATPVFLKMMDNFFGLQADGSYQERNYYPLLDALNGPVDLLTGTAPLMPIRQIQATPCMIDDADISELTRYPVRLHRVEGGHDLLVGNPDSCEPILRDWAGRSGHR